ncbi:MAG: M3 family metallopeptidase [Chitinophagales bacterium]
MEQGYMQEQRINTQTLISKLSELYTDISPEIGNLFSFMLNNNWIDYEVRQNKSSGSFMCYFYNEKIPFLYSNLSGNYYDYKLITHEFGHCIQCYLAKDYTYKEQLFATKEIAEIQAAAVEIYVLNKAKQIFSEDYDKFVFKFCAKC